MHSYPYRAYAFLLLVSHMSFKVILQTANKCHCRIIANASPPGYQGRPSLLDKCTRTGPVQPNRIWVNAIFECTDRKAQINIRLSLASFKGDVRELVLFRCFFRRRFAIGNKHRSPLIIWRVPCWGNVCIFIIEKHCLQRNICFVRKFARQWHAPRNATA